MFKKFSSGILILILIVLLAVYFIVRFTGQKERTFKDKVLSFDPAVITNIQIKDPSQEQAVELRLSGNTWEVVSGVRTYLADSNIVKGILNQLSDLPTKRFAGRGKDSWEKYELTEDKATLVTLKAGTKQIASIYIGKFSYNMPKEQSPTMQMRQQQGDMTTYVRVEGDQDVYGVEGFLRMSFNRDPSNYRFRGLVGVNPEDITRIMHLENGTEAVMELRNGKWIMNEMPADSVEVARYMSSLARLSGSKFIEEETVPGPPAHTVTVEGSNFQPVQLKAFPVSDTNVHYVITSSINPGSFFNGKEGGLFDKIFRSLPN